MISCIMYSIQVLCGIIGRHQTLPLLVCRFQSLCVTDAIDSSAGALSEALMQKLANYPVQVICGKKVRT